MNDLEYLKQGLFTSFFPDTKEGEQVWREIAAQSEGRGFRNLTLIKEICKTQ
jgi:hypothetical protein